MLSYDMNRNTGERRPLVEYLGIGKAVDGTEGQVTEVVQAPPTVVKYMM